MMSTCNEVNDELADLVAGDRDAIARHAEHLATCDECRDARHEAAKLAALLGQAGSDHVPQKDLSAKLLAAIGDDAKPVVVAAPVAKPVEKTIAAKQPVAKRAGNRAAPRAMLWAGAAAAVIAGGVGFYKLKHADDVPVITAPTKDSPAIAANEIGKITTIARAANDGGSGVQVKDGSAWRAVAKGEIVPTGATIKTDECTRVGVRMTDGTVLILDHATVLTFDPKQPRTMTMA
ncbi:MAG: hypothetical protein ABI175_09575, partial [Polyangiales bacterium]